MSGVEHRDHFQSMVKDYVNFQADFFSPKKGEKVF